jgi:putative transposase
MDRILVGILQGVSFMGMKGRIIRLYPKKEEKKYFSLCFRFSNRAWNICHANYLAHRQAKKCNLNPTFRNDGKSITNNKDDLDKKADSKIKNYVTKSYNQAWKKSHTEKETSTPKFHSFRKSKKSYTTDKPKFEGKKLILPKCKPIKFKGELLDYEIANITIFMKNNKYYASIIYKNVEIPPLVNTNRDLGIDWGEITFLALSDDIKINPIINHELEEKINYLTRELSYKKLYSKNWYRLKTKIDKLKEKRTNRLKDWYHKLTTQLVKNYDNIFIEKLNYKTIHQKAKKFVSKLKKTYYQFGTFKTMTNYKLNWYKNTKLIEIDANNTSKTCSTCGYIKKDLNIHIRTWKCPVCKSNHDRDINASKNILKRGLEKINNNHGRQELPSLAEIGESMTETS